MSTQIATTQQTSLRARLANRLDDLSEFDAAVVDSLLSKIQVNESTGCWEWTAALSRGYGQLTVHGKHLRAHRESARVILREDTAGQFVCHHCDNRSCINPDHLYVGDAKTNRHDAINRDRWSHPYSRNTHCANGHKYVDGSYRIAKDGSRVCRVCMKHHQAAFRARSKK